MSSPIPFDEVGRLPLPGDNVAIAIRRLNAGTAIRFGEEIFTLDSTVLEGHRFAVEEIPNEAPLLSWQLPFGYALRPIAPGSYVCNASTLAALAGRAIDFDLPARPNFVDRITPFQLDEANFVPAQQVPPAPDSRTFLGYRRAGGRGVGTRNTIVLLGVNSRAGGFVRRLEERLSPLAIDYANVDAIVAIAHTEGADAQPNNLDFTLRTLAGFMVHPNVGAVLAVDMPGQGLSHARLQAFMAEHGYPREHVPHTFLTLNESFQGHLAQAEEIVRTWLPVVNETHRSAEPLSALKIALQCGGSDAFSGVSGNPLASWVAREIIRHGGSANLAETDELIGAEPYVLQKVRDPATARKFLATVDRFKAWAQRHGTSAEGNPSGGNKYRGLYNIVLKSIGAAMKRHPDVRLDAVIDYAEPMTEPGYYFMDSPGNDLESIAGQVAAGCNLIFFVTGNGSITNFPFVPTIKIVTTTARYTLLQQDMDVNAGAYLDGTPMDELGAEMLALTLRVAAGELSVGERAGHAQVQLWRNWRLAASQTAAPAPDTFPGDPYSWRAPRHDAAQLADLQYPATVTPWGRSSKPVALILPTSLCAGQVAEMAARRLNRGSLAAKLGIDSFVALAHTEGCGCSPAAKEVATTTLLNYLRHPRVAHALLLEHGCEITHNDHMRHSLAAHGLAPEQFGWASIQLDGGIEHVLANIDGWFAAQNSGARGAGATALLTRRIGLFSTGDVPAVISNALSRLATQVGAAGGAIILPTTASLLQDDLFWSAVSSVSQAGPTLGYGQVCTENGLHIMDTATVDWAETLVGLGATGVDIVIAYVAQQPLSGHPLTPLVQISSTPGPAAVHSADEDVSVNVDVDLLLHDTDNEDEVVSRLGDVLRAVLAGEEETVAVRNGDLAFQLSRGSLGISL